MVSVPGAAMFWHVTLLTVRLLYGKTKKINFSPQMWGFYAKLPYDSETNSLKCSEHTPLHGADTVYLFLREIKIR